MEPIAAVQDQIKRTLADLGAFDATCPGCGKGHAFITEPRFSGRLSPWPGRSQTVRVLLPCTRCSYAAEHTVDVAWPASEGAMAA